MTDQKKSSADRKDPSVPVPLDADWRRRMREAAEAAAREAPGEWRTGERGAAGFWLGFHAVTCDATGEAGEVLSRAVLLQPNPYFPVEPISRYVVETQPSAVLSLFDALDQAERERDVLREKLAAAERRVEELEGRDNARRNDAWEESEQG